MIAFVRIPAQHAPIGGELSYGIETDAAAIGIRIRRAGPDDSGPEEASQPGALLGAKRFVGVGRVACDVAPCVRAAVRFEPSTGATGFRPAGDRVTAVAVEAFAIGAEASGGAVSGTAASAAAGAAAPEPSGGFDADAAAPSDGVPEAGDTGSGSAEGAVVASEPVTAVTAAVRRFLPCAAAVAAPALLTSMPRERLIAPGESDELTLLADEPLAVTVAATRAGGACEVRTYRSAAAGLQLFRFDTRDFPGAERATVDAGPCGTVAYSLLPAPEGARRLAWRTAEGSVEHYTFPIVRTRRVRVDRERVRGPEGIRSAAVRVERCTTVESAYESPAMLGALAGLLAAPQVWAAEPEGYRPVDIVTGEAVVHRHGTLSSFEATFRSTAETPQPWN